MKSRTLNMTAGRPLVLLSVFALPLLIGNLFQQAYNLVDSVIVGRFVGASALAAVGATNAISFLFFSVCNGISGGGGIITSQYFGAGDDRRVQKAIVNSAYITLVSSLAMGALALCLAPSVLRLLRTPADIMHDAVLYMRMMCISVPLIGIYNYASSMLRALGDSKTPLYFLTAACLINTGLDLLFVGGFGMGVFGAALATMISQLIAGVSSLLFAFKTNRYFHSLNRSHMVFDRYITRQAVRLGLPLAMQWSMIAFSTTALQSFVNSFGTTAVAAFTATSRIEQLVQQPFGSLGVAMATYAGQNFGAGKMDRIRTGLKDTILGMGAFSIVMTVIMQLFGSRIIRIFVTDPAVTAMGGTALKLTSIFYIFLGIIYTTRGALNGVGDVLFSFINGFSEVICRIFLPMLLMLIPGAGVWSIWWTAGLTWLISALCCLIRYRSWEKRFHLI